MRKCCRSEYWTVDLETEQRMSVVDMKDAWIDERNDSKEDRIQFKTYGGV